MKKLIILCFAMLSITSMAEAYTQPALMFKPNDTTSAESLSCYSWNAIGGTKQGLTRTCPGVFAIDMPLTFDQPGNWQVVVYASRPSTATNVQVTCQVWTITNQGGYNPSRTVSLTGATNTFLPITLPPVNVPTGATGFVRCLMTQNTSILMVDANVCGPFGC